MVPHAPPVGLIVIPDPFLPGRQHRWVWQCLVNYPCRPSVCNLDAHMKRSGEGRIWPAAWYVCHATAVCDPKHPIVWVYFHGISSGGLKKQKLSKDDLLYKLRWVTLGYHYDWNTKVHSLHSIDTALPDHFLALRYRSTTVTASLHFLRISQNCPHSFWRWLDSPSWYYRDLT